MGSLIPDQRNAFYLREAERAGIHKPILAALYQAHHSPSLSDGEVGLGISPANRVALNQVDTFAAQVQYAASTIRCLTSNLTVGGWKPKDMWDAEKGHYTEKFIRAIATGFIAPASDPTAALLETSDADALMEAYLADFKVDIEAKNVSQNQAYLDQALKTFIEQVPFCFLALPCQRDALLEMVRIWGKQDTRAAAIAALEENRPSNISSSAVDKAQLNPALLLFIQRVSPTYSGYPHQREALLCMVKRWQQLESREAAIASLQYNSSPAPNPAILDSVVIALIHKIPQRYQGKGNQRNALVEGFRAWQQLDSRSAALVTLGVNPDLFSNQNLQQKDLKNAAIQLDRALLNFVRQIPTIYEGLEYQRDSLIHLIQLWRDITTREQAVEALYDDLKQMENARHGSFEAPPVPNPVIKPSLPESWTPTNIQLFAPIIPDGSFTWAEATLGGTYMPSSQTTIEAIIRIASMAQQARDRVGRPFQVVNWYRPAENHTQTERTSLERNAIGDAITFYCEGLTGNQLYWFLDPWWTGGLGHSSRFPYLIQIDSRGYRARWLK